MVPVNSSPTLCVDVAEELQRDVKLFPPGPPGPRRRQCGPEFFLRPPDRVLDVRWKRKRDEEPVDAHCRVKIDYRTEAAAAVATAPDKVEPLVKRRVVVHDKMQRGYVYYRTEPPGRNFDPAFAPELTPRADARARRVRRTVHDRLPRRVPEDLVHAREAVRCQARRRCSTASASTHRSRSPCGAVNGWVSGQDPRGWFQWYCRYYMGRRSPDDARQIRRWRAIARHIGAIRKHCEPGDVDCRRRQRQAVLHWAYDSRML